MSVQAGIWNFDGRPVDRALLETYSARLSRSGPDGEGFYVDGAIAMLYRPHHRTGSSRLERQPCISRRGNVMTWDGWLDNRETLAREMGLDPREAATDADVALKAFDRWGPECCARFIGDWAFACWDPSRQRLTLAIDYMAIQHLHYHLKADGVVWCSDLEELASEAKDKFQLDDEYVAGYLAYSPVPGHTPYRELRRVEPGCYVEICPSGLTRHSYFKFNPKFRIAYKTDVEYEEHFLHIFRQAVRRRLRSDAPILADLSGGLDSSSIVCMADDILAKEGAETPRLDTYSHFDLGEPDGDDLHYLSIVEERRGRKGHHLDAAQYSSSILPDPASFAVLPGGLCGVRGLQEDYDRIFLSGHYKVGLSGLGGDEMLAGVPDPRPELADLIVQLKLVQFARQTLAWSTIKRRPWIYLAARACALLLPPRARVFMSRESRTAPWIARSFARDFRMQLRQLGPLERYGFRLPSRQWAARTAVAMQRFMADRFLDTSVEEVRYPYLDQDLVEFLIAVPRTQLIRPGQRRSLMRRALSSLLPPEVLSRRTKGTAVRRPLLAMAGQWPALEKIVDSSLGAQAGYLDQRAWAAAVISAKNGKAPELTRLLQTLAFEIWLNGAVNRGLIRPPRSSSPAGHQTFITPAGTSAEWKPS